MGLSIGPISSAAGAGGDVTENVYIPAIALFEHPEDATTLFEAVDSGTEGLTVTLREPLEYGQDTSQWSIVGAQRYQGAAEVAAVSATVTLATSATGGITVTVVAAGAAGNNLSLTVSPGASTALVFSGNMFTLAVGDDATAANALAALNGHANLSAAYYGTETGTTVIRSGNGPVIAGVVGLRQFAGGADTIPEIPADPTHVVIDPDTMTITAYYNIAAGGLLTEADTLGDLKGAFDTAGEGLSSEYVGGGDMDTVVTRPFANVSTFTQADLRGLRLMLTDPVAPGAAGNAVGLVARARFPGGAEVQERQAHILIYTSTSRGRGVRIALDADIPAPNEHGTLVDSSSGALGNEWTFTVLDADGQRSNVIAVNATARQIVYYAPFAAVDVAATVLHDACNAQGGVSATYFGGQHGGAHPFDGALGRINTLPQRFHGGQDYHAATTNPEPITVTEGPTHAHTRLYTVADGGIVLSLTNPAHDGGNGFDFESVEGDPLGVEVVPTAERITLTIPTAGATAAAILAAFNADEALSAVYFGTEDGTNNVLPARFGRHEMLGGLDSDEIEVQYAPVATGGITDVDTMGEVKTVWDAGSGRISFYYGGADANTDASRRVPWEHEFEGGETRVISLAGFGLGPEQNEFTGADRASAEAARDTYAAANPTWVEAYRGLPDVWIVLRWGTDQVGQVLRAGAANPPAAGDWIDQDLALRGSRGATGTAGHSPVFSSGDAFPATPAPAANDFHIFPNDVASGLSWLDSDGTTPLVAAAVGDVARYNGSTWVKQANLISNDGVLTTATFDGTSYAAVLGKSVGADVTLDLSPIMTALDAVRTRLTALEGGSTTGTIWFGWSADQTIATADFANFNSVTNMLEGTLPNTMVDAYVVVAVPQADGLPEGIFIAEGANSFDGFTQQAGTVDDTNGVATLVLVSNDTLLAAFSGAAIRVEFPT